MATSKKGYVIVEGNVTDPVKYEKYKALSPIAVAAYGGKWLTRGGAVTPVEGGWEPTRIVVIEFESVAQALKFYNSPEYVKARKEREGAAVFKMIVVEGL